MANTRAVFICAENFIDQFGGNISGFSGKFQGGAGAFLELQVKVEIARRAFSGERPQSSDENAKYSTRASADQHNREDLV